MYRRLLLLVAVLLAGGCPGSAKVPRHDVSWRADGEPLPIPIAQTPRALDGSVPKQADAHPVSTPQPQPDAQPASPPVNPACGSVDAPCGSGQPACCAGGLCVNFGAAVTCGKICTDKSQCPESCCIATTGGTSVCAPSSFCPASPPPQDPPPQDPPPQDPPPQNPPTGGSCKGSCGGQSGNCYCDVFCLAYGDCCPDVYLCWI